MRRQPCIMGEPVLHFPEAIMALTLFYHPLASFCHKVLMALYENGTPFTGKIIDLLDETERDAFLQVWPVGKIPVLRDDARQRTLPETSIIIEYLDRYHPGPCALLPADADQRLEARLWDRFFDLYVQVPMQKLVTDRLRPDHERDTRGVSESIAALKTAYDMLDRHMASRTWAIGETFSLADCAAAPALFYADIVVPFSNTHAHAARYYARLENRPSFQRLISEARPYFQYFPYKEAMPARFLEGKTQPG